MKIVITAVCNIGTSRENNEDMVLVGEKLFRDGKFQDLIELDGRDSPIVFAVADGMGGANAGEVASQMVLEQIRDSLAAAPADLDNKALQNRIGILCLEIHQNLLHEAAVDSSKYGMGATLVGLLIYQQRLLYLSAGDSRLYRFRDSTLKQISTDHSVRALSGAGDAPRNLILNSFGGGSSFYVDFGVAARKALDEDVFLLCSDGLSDTLSDEEIEAILCTDGRANALLSTALAKGSRDNVSYVLIQVSDVHGGDPSFERESTPPIYSGQA